MAVFKDLIGTSISERNQQTGSTMINRRAFLTAALAGPATAFLGRPAVAAKPQVFSDGGVAIHDGKLYLNYSVNVRQVWSEDIPRNIERADGFWPTALGRLGFGLIMAA